MHHAVKGRRNSVSFGFLYAPSAATLKKQLRDQRSAAGCGRCRDLGGMGTDLQNG
jgi:beta-carotene 3-hydroxylase